MSQMIAITASHAAPRIETRSIDHVPPEARHGRVSAQGPFWFLSNFQFLTTTLGFIGPAMGLSFGWAVLAGTLGTLFGTIFMALHAMQGPVLGLPQMIQSRAQFGYRGVIIPLLVALFTFIGLNVVNALLVAQGMQALFGWSPALSLAGVLLASFVIAAFGHDLLHSLFRVMFFINIPLYIVLCAAVPSLPVPTHPLPSHGFTITAFMAQFLAAASYNLAYAPYVSDYSRYLPEKTKPLHIISMVFLGIASSSIWMIALGAWLATRLPGMEAISVLNIVGNITVFHGFGTILVLDAVAVLAAVIGLNAYSGMMVTITVLDCIRPVRSTLMLRLGALVALSIMWVVPTMLVSQDAIAALSTILSAMLYLLVPWTSVNLVDYFLVHRGAYDIAQFFAPRGLYAGWNWRGLLAYGLGIAAAIPLAVLPGLYIGPLARHVGGIDLAWIAELVVSAASCFLLAQKTDHAPASTLPAAPLSLPQACTDSDS